MYHVAGWVVAFLPTTLVGGATVIPEVGFDSATISVGRRYGALSGSPDVVAAGRQAAESAIAAAAAHAVTVVPGAPGFFHHLIGMDCAQQSLATVRLLTSGTAPLDTGDFGAVQTLVGHPVWEGYGLSEAASVVASTLMTDEPRHGSVGKPLSGIELRIVGPDGRDVNADDEADSCGRRARRAGGPARRHGRRSRCRRGRPDRDPRGHPVLRVLAGRRRRAGPRTAGSSPATSASWTTTASCTWSTGPRKR